MNILERELANLHWDLYVSYKADDGAVSRRLGLWAEVDRVEALLELEQ